MELQSFELTAANALLDKRIGYMSDINNLGVSENERAQKFLEFEMEIEKSERDRLKKPSR